MLPSSFNKTCCDAQTCPKLNQKKQDESLEEDYQMTGEDKETQMSPVAVSPSSQTLIPAKTAEKPTEAYLNRNNENISYYLNKFCPSNSSEISPPESQKSALMLKCYPAPTKTDKSPPGHQPQLICRSLHKCTCKKLNLTPSSSCSSLSMGAVPKNKWVSKKSRGQRFQKTLTKNVNNSHNEMPKSDFTNCNNNSGNFWQFLKKLSAPFGEITECDDMEDEFYSCNSEDSEEDDEKSENLFGYLNRYYTDQNLSILQLLQEVENLINKDKRIRDRFETAGGPSSPIKSSSEKTTPEAIINNEINFKISKQTSTTLIDTLFLPPPPPCVCNCLDHFTPNNLTNPASAGTKTAEPFLYEEITSLKVASSSNPKILITDQLQQNLSSVSVPVDFPILKDDIKTQCFSLTAINNIKMEKSTQHINGTSKPVKDIEIDYDNYHCLCEDVDSFKDCSSGNNNLSTTVPDQLPAHFISNCIGHQIVLECSDKSLTLTIIPVAGIKSNRAMKKTSVKMNSIGSQVNLDVCQCPAEIKQQYKNINNESFQINQSNTKFLPEPILGDSSDEKIVLPFQLYQPCLDCLMEYDDEEPNFKNTSFPTIQEVNKEIQNINLEALKAVEQSAEPIDFEPTAELEMLPDVLQLEVKTQHVGTASNEEFIENAELVEAEPFNEQNILPNITKIESERFSLKKEDEVNDAEKPLDKTEESDYNDEEEHELAKEELLESCKENKSDENYQNHDNKEKITLPTLKQVEGNGGCAEMKFFIDSLILDLEAMDYARRKTQFDKKICKTKKLSHCIRDSFPVTIIDVTVLGANSLYVKWKIHDCFGIGGYEIYTDGYLTNRFYNSRHVAAVLTQVDITLPHKIALLALPIEALNESLDFICNMNKTNNRIKSLNWKTHDETQQLRNVRASWTPSIFLYDPTSGRAASSISTF